MFIQESEETHYNQSAFLLENKPSQAQRYTPVIPARGRWNQEEQDQGQPRKHKSQSQKNQN